MRTNRVAARRAGRLKFTDVVFNAVAAKGVQTVEQTNWVLHDVETDRTFKLLLQILKNSCRDILLRGVRQTLSYNLSRFADHLVAGQI